MKFIWNRGRLTVAAILCLCGANAMLTPAQETKAVKSGDAQAQSNPVEDKDAAY